MLLARKVDDEEVTLTKVAQNAHVSTSTVSRYLRGELNVSAGTAVRIDKAVSDLGYKRRSSGSRHGDSGIICLVIPDFTNPFFNSLAEKCQEMAEARQLPLVVVRGGRQEDEERNLGRVLDSGLSISGLIHAGINRHSDRLEDAVANGLPLVIIDREIEQQFPAHTITVDNYGGAFQVTSYLLHLGHRSIAHITGPNDLSTTKSRVLGYREAIESFGLPVDEKLIIHGPHTEQFGASVFSQFTRQGISPTAVFAGSDIIAVGMLSAAGLHGISIPEDLSVVGCDGIRVGQWLRPRLTTLEQPVEGIAQRALDAITGENAGMRSGNTRLSQPTRTVLPLHLVIRGSAAPLEGS